MSNISTVYDQILSVLAVLFPDKKEIPIPDELIKNDIPHLNNGYGVVIGPALPEEFEFNQYMEVRQIAIVFTERVDTLRSDASKAKTVKKNILEDEVTLKKDFLNNDQISIASNIQNIEWVNSSEISLIPGMPEEIILTSSITFEFKISETI